MQFYFLDNDPITSANSLCLFSQQNAINTNTQLLSNVHHLLLSMDPKKLLRPFGIHNRYTKWVAEGELNYTWVVLCTIQLLNNYAEIRGKEHSYRAVLSKFLHPPDTLKAIQTKPTIGFIPYEFRSSWMEEDPNYEILCYRSYYLSILQRYMKEDSHYVEFLGQCPDWMPLKALEGRSVKSKMKRWNGSKSITYSRENNDNGIIRYGLSDLEKPVPDISINRVVKYLDESEYIKSEEEENHEGFKNEKERKFK